MIAVATPAMLPVPIEAPSAVMKAWNGESTPPVAAFDSFATIARNASGNRRSCTTPNRSVRNAPVRSSSHITTFPNSQVAKVSM